MWNDFDPFKVLVLIGFSGSGKSFLAKRLAKKYGYTVLRSDEIRKRLAGIDPYSSAKSDFGKGIYTPEMTRKTYETMIEKAKEIVSRGGKVILDATFLRKWQRELVFRHFPSAVFIWVWTPEGVIIERLKTRKGDISDADISVYRKQKEIFEPPTESLLTFVVRGDRDSFKLPMKEK
jgi:gluconokinase